MIDKLERRSARPIFAMLIPSIIILPSVASANRKNAMASVLFPLPAGPITPILDPA